MNSEDRRFTSRDYSAAHAAAFAARYDDGIHAVKEQVLRRFLGDVRGLAVLDLGCGVGNFAALCADRGAVPVVACDFAQSMVEATARRYPGRFHLVRGSAEDPPFAPRRFDLILALDVIEHLYRPEHMLARASTLLRPQGRLLITTDRAARFHAGFLPKYARDALRGGLRRLGWLPPAPPSPYQTPLCTHVHEYRLRELAQLAGRAGFHLAAYDTYSLRPRYSAYGRLVEKIMVGPLRQFKWDYVIYDFRL